MGLSPGAAAQAGAGFDHHHPQQLNEAALQQLKLGAGDTARVLLERAVTLAPGEERIRANAATLRALQSDATATPVRVIEGPVMAERAAQPMAVVTPENTGGGLGAAGVEKPPSATMHEALPALWPFRK